MKSRTKACSAIIRSSRAVFPATSSFALAWKTASSFPGDPAAGPGNARNDKDEMAAANSGPVRAAGRIFMAFYPPVMAGMRARIKKHCSYYCQSGALRQVYYLINYPWYPAGKGDGAGTGCPRPCVQTESPATRSGRSMILGPGRVFARNTPASPLSQTRSCRSRQPGWRRSAPGTREATRPCCIL